MSKAKAKGYAIGIGGGLLMAVVTLVCGYGGIMFLADTIRYIIH